METSDSDAAPAFNFMADAAPSEAADPEFEAKVMEALRTVRDPEIPVNLVDLGLIYEFTVSAAGRVFVEMTLTSPSCPVAGGLPGEVEQAVRSVPGVTDAEVTLTFDPPWHPGLMSEEAKLELGML